MSLTIYPGRKVIDTTSTLSQVIRGEVVALAERTEQLNIRTMQLQTHADRELCDNAMSQQANKLDLTG